MSDCARSLWNPDFSHVYVEADILSHPVTNRILSRLPRASVIPISHYKDLFCRKNQRIDAQRNSRKLILAKKRDSFLYKGSAMCDDFGNPNFYYSADIMNCVYQCEYCYLQGLYPTANLVVFVNLEDTFRELDKCLAIEPRYVCISYDTDLLALETLTGFAAEWIAYALVHPGLKVELRTKSDNFRALAGIPAPPNVILAWSLSPARIAACCEVHAPSLASRLRAMNEAIDKGWKVRLCIDPMLRTKEWKEDYEQLYQTIRSVIRPDRLLDVSIGVFRLPKDSLGTIRAIHPGSALLAYPFQRTAAGWSYSETEKEEMIGYLKDRFAADRVQIHAAY